MAKCGETFNRTNPSRLSPCSIGATIDWGGPVKGVGGGVLEYRIDFGPGYRVYLGRDEETIIILLGGGTKKRQSDDIVTAKARWNDYRQRRKEEK